MRAKTKKPVVWTGSDTKNGGRLVRRSLGGGGTQTPKACVSTGGAAEERKARIPACVSTGGAAEERNAIAAKTGHPVFASDERQSGKRRQTGLPSR